MAEFYIGLSYSKSPLVSRTHLSILADFSNVMVSVFLISTSSSLLFIIIIIGDDGAKN